MCATKGASGAEWTEIGIAPEEIESDTALQRNQRALSVSHYAAAVGVLGEAVFRDPLNELCMRHPGRHSARCLSSAGDRRNNKQCKLEKKG